MGICLVLGPGLGLVRVGVMVRLYFAVVLRNIFTILRIPHCTDAEWKLR